MSLVQRPTNADEGSHRHDIGKPILLAVIDAKDKPKTTGAVRGRVVDYLKFTTKLEGVEGRVKSFRREGLIAFWGFSQEQVDASLAHAMRQLQTTVTYRYNVRSATETELPFSNEEEVRQTVGDVVASQIEVNRSLIRGEFEGKVQDLQAEVEKLEKERDDLIKRKTQMEKHAHEQQDELSALRERSAKLETEIRQLKELEASQQSMQASSPSPTYSVVPNVRLWDGDIDQVNKALKELKWPVATPQDLSSVIIAGMTDRASFVRVSTAQFGISFKDMEEVRAYLNGRKWEDTELHKILNHHIGDAEWFMKEYDSLVSRLSPFARKRLSTEIGENASEHAEANKTLLEFYKKSKKEYEDHRSEIAEAIRVALTISKAGHSLLEAAKRWNLEGRLPVVIHSTKDGKVEVLFPKGATEGQMDVILIAVIRNAIVACRLIPKSSEPGRVLLDETPETLNQARVNALQAAIVGEFARHGFVNMGLIPVVYPKMGTTTKPVSEAPSQQAANPK